jgi:RING finger protein 113A
MFNRADKIIAKMEKKRKEKGLVSDAEDDEDAQGTSGGVEIEGLKEEKGGDGDDSEEDEDSD